jgi:phospholipid transport system transporter-binding protein
MKLLLTNNKVELVGNVDRFNLADSQLFTFPPIASDVTIDLDKVTSVDTAGVAYILKLVAHYQNETRNIELTNPPTQLIALAQISNVLGLLPLKK